MLHITKRLNISSLENKMLDFGKQRAHFKIPKISYRVAHSVQNNIDLVFSAFFTVEIFTVSVKGFHHTDNLVFGNMLLSIAIITANNISAVIIDLQNSVQHKLFSVFPLIKRNMGGFKGKLRFFYHHNIATLSQ